MLVSVVFVIACCSILIPVALKSSWRDPDVSAFSPSAPVDCLLFIHFEPHRDLGMMSDFLVFFF